MKQVIAYYYNIQIEDFEQDKNICCFNFNKCKFYFVPYNRDEKSLREIIEVSREMKVKNIKCHDIIINKFNNVLTKFNEENYMLLKVCDDLDRDFNIFDMFFISKKLRLLPNKQKEYKNNWSEYWKRNVDYFESQIRNYGKLKMGILNTFSYYIGLAENAIEYAGIIEKELRFNANDDSISLGHRRIFSPNYQLNYLNPISFIFDLDVRDYAEYFKARFFNDGNIYQEFVSFFKTVRFGIYSYSMFYARLVYPSYYFDLYEQVILNDKNEELLIDIVNKQKEYEKFLGFAYQEISKYAPIKKIPWMVS